MVQGKSILHGLMLIGLGVSISTGISAPSLATASSPLLPLELSLIQDPPNVPDLGEASKYLPGQAQVHLLLKIGERRVYVYEGDQVVASYPVAVGKTGWETPTGEFKVFNLEIDPVFLSLWTGNKIGPGPDNPLGPRWIGFWTDGKTQVGFHGTNAPDSIGQAISHGCVRMHNKDVIALYEKVKLGTQVIVQP